MRASEDGETPQYDDGDYISGSRTDGRSEYDRNREFHPWEDDAE